LWVLWVIVLGFGVKGGPGLVNGLLVGVPGAWVRVLLLLEKQLRVLLEQLLL
jgi:hypothetical protein